MADFLEKVSYRIGVCPVSAQKEQRGNQQGNAERTNEAINEVVGLQCEPVIVLQNGGLREENSLCNRSVSTAPGHNG